MRFRVDNRQIYGHYYSTMQDPVIVRKKLGDRVRFLRLKKGWSQEQLARESGLGRSFTGSIERGEKDLRIRTLCKLADVFKITFSELMEGIEDFSSRFGERKAKRPTASKKR
jgi:transcriptional regulator with XRE-family HTH domain